MRYYLLPSFFIYLCLFFPEAYQLKLIAICLALLLLVIFRSSNEALFLILISILSFVSLSDATDKTALSIAIEDESIKSLYGIAVSEPASRGNRNVGYRMKLYAAGDDNQSVFSAKGVLYVISEQSDIHIGDYVAISGNMKDKYFKAESTELIRKNSTGRLRIKLISLIDGRLKGEGRSLSSMLLLGSDLDGANVLSDKARSAGLSHVIALSGMHLSILSLIAMKPLERIFGKRIGRAAGLLMLLVFVYLSGWKPSLLRSFIFLVLLGHFPIDISFSLSFIVLLAISPTSISDLGTIFSFVSLSGILLFSKRIDRVLFSLYLPKILSSGMAASISALMLSTPIAYIYFESYQLLSIVSSIPAGFLIALYMYLTLAAVMMPCLESIKEWVYALIVRFFDYFSSFPMLETLKGYWIMLALALIILAIDILKRRDVAAI